MPQLATWLPDVMVSCLRHWVVTHLPDMPWGVILLHPVWLGMNMPRVVVDYHDHLLGLLPLEIVVSILLFCFEERRWNKGIWNVSIWCVQNIKKSWHQLNYKKHTLLRLNRAPKPLHNSCNVVSVISILFSLLYSYLIFLLCNLIFTINVIFNLFNCN